MNHLDLFSGIGGFSLGLKNAGISIKNSYFSEIDKYAIQVYQNNFKESKYVGSVTDIRGEQLPKIDIITFGSPCQDFSLAGKRTGMQGNRSSLISEAIRLISECRPRFFVWENVKGTFSSNDSNDFWEIIKTFANIGGYRLEWQLLNTSWFLPQNRERIYLVGYIGNGSGKQVFPIRENTKRINERTKQTATVRTLTAGGNSGGMHSSMTLLKIGDYRYDEGFRWRTENSPCLTVATSEVIYLKQKKIRRLTPLECERLQGFPDNWTQYGTDGLISDSQRYKMCGNAVTVDVVQAVGERIKNAI